MHTVSLPTRTVGQEPDAVTLNPFARPISQGTDMHMRSPIRPRRCPPAALVAGTVLLAATAAGAAETPTFSRDVAPILFEKCVQCHRPNQAAPMSLLSYGEARPWARGMARAVENGDMPPWSGESERVVFRNDLSLSAEQIATITGWAAGGAPEGDPADLPAAPTFSDGWTLGEPDYVLTLDRIEVPADGPDLFPKQRIELDLAEERWVQAIEFLPGDRRATHHFQATYTTPRRESGGPIGSGERVSQGAAGSGVFGIWTAGMPPYVFPEGTGRVLGPGTTITMDSHYHPFGEATSDVTRIGIHFGEGELEREVATVSVANTGIRIPPGAGHHAEEGFFQPDDDMQILAFSPHMHVRGKAMTYRIVHADGTSETLLDVPKYDYNWQWLYYPTEPVDLPASSRIEVTAVWDNSEDNPANPDPAREIIYRGDVFNEMFVGFMEVVRKDGGYHRPKANVDKLQDLIAGHPGETSFVAGGFLPFAFWAPREGEGILYVASGLQMFTITLDDVAWSGDRLQVTTHFPTPEASAITTVIDGERGADGVLRGTITMGADTESPFEMKLVAEPAGLAPSGDATGAAAGG